MSAPFPSLTKKWHTSSHPAIDPTRPELSAAGKTLVITGGGSGIGAQIASAFAKAGAPRIALLGRTQKTLSETEATLKKINSSIKVLTATADITDKTSLEAAFTTVVDTFGKIDIFVSNAGYLSVPATVAELDGDDWWAGFKINALGSLYSAQAFIPRATEGAYLFNVTSGIAHLPPIAGFSGYATSKLANAKLFDYVQVENPSLHVVNIQPGIVESSLNSKSGMGGMDTSKWNEPLKSGCARLGR